MISNGTEDAFRYLYQGISGNTTVVARVITLEDTHDQAKAGVMMRAGLDAESRDACIVVTPGGGLSFLWRTNKGKCGNASLTGIATPCWVKIVRHASSFTAFYSEDGVKWMPLGAAVTIEMTDPIYLGMAVSSHVTDQCCTATFDNVQITEDPAGGAEPRKPVPAAPAMLDLLAGLEKGTVHAPDAFGPEAPKGWVTLDNDSRALTNGGSGWTRKAGYIPAACAQTEKTDFSKDVQAAPVQASRWICKASYAARHAGV